MSFVDQLKELEKKTQKAPAHTYTYSSFLSSHFIDSIRNTCMGNIHQHVLKGFYYEKFGYDHDDYGFTDKNTEETHISRNDLKNADIALLKQETIHKLQTMGFRIVDVQITKHNKQIQIPSGYGILGIKKQYKSTTIDYLRIYIHIEW